MNANVVLWLDRHELGWWRDANMNARGVRVGVQRQHLIYIQDQNTEIWIADDPDDEVYDVIARPRDTKADVGLVRHAVSPITV